MALSFVLHHSIKSEIEKFKSIRLSLLEQYSLANAAIDIRFDKQLHDVNAKEFLKITRDEDEIPTLWNVFNRV